MSDDERWCFAWFAGANPGAGTTRAGLQNDAAWLSPDRITIRFLEGDQKLQKRVKDAALQWTAPGLANLKLIFTEDVDADVRISFRPGKGSWSTVGTTCRKVPKTSATMNFGWIDAESDEDKLCGVVLHEFGHALGLIHEHQIPGGISWNREAVIKDLSGPPNCWSEAKIDFNVLTPADPQKIDNTELDADSIMMYAFPASWTTNGVATKANDTLSLVDKKFIHKKYP